MKKFGKVSSRTRSFGIQAVKLVWLMFFVLPFFCLTGRKKKNEGNLCFIAGVGEINKFVFYVNKIHIGLINKKYIVINFEFKNIITFPPSLYIRSFIKANLESTSNLANRIYFSITKRIKSDARNIFIPDFIPKIKYKDKTSSEVIDANMQAGQNGVSIQSIGNSQLRSILEPLSFWRTEESIESSLVVFVPECYPIKTFDGNWG